MRQSNNFWSVLAVLVCGLSFFYCWQFLMPSFRTNQVKLAQAEADKKAIKAKLDSLSKAKTTMDSLGGVLDQIFVAVPKDKDTPNIVAELEALSSLHKTAISTIQITESPGAVDEVNISFSVAGTFEEMNGFIKSIEKNAKFMNIKSVSISGTDRYIALTFQITAYKQMSSI